MLPIISTSVRLLRSESVRALHFDPCPDFLWVPLSMALQSRGSTGQSALDFASRMASRFQPILSSRHDSQPCSLYAGWPDGAPRLPPVQKAMAQRTGSDSDR